MGKWQRWAFPGPRLAGKMYIEGVEGQQERNKALEPQLLSQGRLQKTGDGAMLPTGLWSW